ncbi:MAG TPA: hypothetical protein VGN83_20775 [Falsiroseomonas sp.]|nr:hypothetical protein [Falsiroseomonas sp.]
MAAAAATVPSGAPCIVAGAADQRVHAFIAVDDVRLAVDQHRGGEAGDATPKLSGFSLFGVGASNSAVATQDATAKAEIGSWVDMI